MLAHFAWQLMAVSTLATDPCDGFKWAVHAERALFAQSPHIVVTGTTPKAAPTIAMDHLQQLNLSAQSDVTFAAPPGNKKSVPGGYAGLVHFSTPSAGVYRISADQPAWIDVVAAGAVIAAKDFEGQKGCSAPHKVVQFLLPASSDLVLQVSGAKLPAVKLALTRAANP